MFCKQAIGYTLFLGQDRRSEITNTRHTLLQLPNGRREASGVGGCSAMRGRTAAATLSLSLLAPIRWRLHLNDRWLSSAAAADEFSHPPLKFFRTGIVLASHYANLNGISLRATILQPVFFSSIQVDTINFVLDFFFLLSSLSLSLFSGFYVN